MSMPLVNVPAGLDTELFCLGAGALKYLPEVLQKAFPGRSAFIVADENTYLAAGKAAKKFLDDASFPVAGEYIFPGTPVLHPDYAYCKLLAEKFPENCVPVAIGSGVINDLTKCASSLKNLRYCCVPTACSVDGFTSAGAALSVEGNKRTVKCPAPQALCADSDILATAPPEMFASGFADLLTKVPAGADWVIADLIGEEPIRKDVWDLIQGNIRKWIADKNDMAAVFDGLAATGYSMQMYQESRPASGAEHLYSHVWEMEGLTKDGKDVSHGFKVGVGSIASTMLMEYVIENEYDDLAGRMKPGLNFEERSAEIDELLVKNCYGAAPKETALKKHLTGEKLAERRNLIRKQWKKLQTGLRERLIPSDELIKILRDAGCPTEAKEIGLDKEQFIHGIKTAQLIRNRYTIIDMLYEAGLLDDALKKLDVMC